MYSFNVNSFRPLRHSIFTIKVRIIRIHGTVCSQYNLDILWHNQFKMKDIASLQHGQVRQVKHTHKQHS